LVQLSARLLVRVNTMTRSAPFAWSIAVSSCAFCRRETGMMYCSMPSAVVPLRAISTYSGSFNRALTLVSTSLESVA